MRNGLNVIQSTGPQSDNNDDQTTGTKSCDDKLSDSDPEKSSHNQGTLLIDATCVPVDIRYPADLSLLNEAREVTEKLINAMYPQVSQSLGNKPRTHRKKARQQFLAVAKNKRPSFSKIRKAIQQQLRHLEMNLCSIDGLIACGASLLAAGRHWYHKLLSTDTQKVLTLWGVLSLISGLGRGIAWGC